MTEQPMPVRDRPVLTRLRAIADPQRLPEDERGPERFTEAGEPIVNIIVRVDERGVLHSVDVEHNAGRVAEVTHITGDHRDQWPEGAWEKCEVIDGGYSLQVMNRQGVFGLHEDVDARGRFYVNVKRTRPSGNYDWGKTTSFLSAGEAFAIAKWILQRVAPAGARQESCVEGRLQLNPLLCGEPFAEHDGELRLGGGPFAWRHLLLAADLAQHQEQQLGCRFVIGEVATAAHCGA